MLLAKQSIPGLIDMPCIKGDDDFNRNVTKFLTEYNFDAELHRTADVILDNNWDTSVNNELSTCLVIGAVDVNTHNRSIYFVGSHPRGYWMVSRINILKVDVSELHRSRCSTVLATNTMSHLAGSLPVDMDTLTKIAKILHTTPRA